MNENTFRTLFDVFREDILLYGKCFDDTLPDYFIFHQNCITELNNEIQ